jgi:hypothetical protein
VWLILLSSSLSSSSSIQQGGVLLLFNLISIYNGYMPSSWSEYHRSHKSNKYHHTSTYGGGGSLLLSYFSLFAFLTPFIYFMSNLYYYDYHLIACLGIAAAVVVQKNTTTTHSTHDFVFLCTQCSSVNMKEWKTCSTTHIYHTPFF